MFDKRANPSEMQERAIAARVVRRGCFCEVRGQSVIQGMPPGWSRGGIRELL
jgi:hypothetical protein